MNNSTLAHEWAHGRTQGKASNMFIEGNIIYSYGKHFPIANRIADGVFLVTTKGYSNTTAKHKGKVHQSVFGKVFYVPEVYPVDHEENLAYYTKEHEERLKTLINGRVNIENRLESINAIVKEQIEYIKYFDLKAEYLKYPDIKTIDLANEKIKKEKEKAKIKEEKEKVKFFVDLEKWRNMEINYIPNSYITRYAFLRIKDDKLQTSKGVSVDLSKARALYSMLLSGKDITSHKIDMYSIDKVTDKEIIAGCHVITREELDKVLS